MHVQVDEYGDLWYVGGTTMLNDLKSDKKTPVASAEGLVIVILALTAAVCIASVFVGLFIILPLLLL